MGKKCDGRTYTADTWGAAVTGYKVELAKLPPPKPVDPKAERIAALSSFFFGVKDADMRKAVAIVEPFALPLFLELGAIVLFLFGLSSKPKSSPVVVPTEPAIVPAVDFQATDVPPSKPNGGTVTKIEAERDLVTYLAIHKQVPSQDELAARWNLGKGTVSKWLADWEERGLIRRIQVGHHKMIESA